MAKRSVSAMQIFSEVMASGEIYLFPNPCNKGQLVVSTSTCNLPASNRGKVDPSHQELIVCCPTGARSISRSGGASAPILLVLTISVVRVSAWGHIPVASS